MKIIKLKSENIKRISAVEITPDGNLVIISGKNGQGKTSVIDSIWFALGGDKAQKNQKKVLRDGADKGSIELDIGEYTVKRTFTEKGSYLTVKNKDNAGFSNPQQLLNDFVGKLSFDPLDYLNMNEKEQVTTLLDIAGLTDKLEKLKKSYKENYDIRADWNREVKRISGKFDADKTFTNGLPEEIISISDLTKELEEKNRLNREAENFNQSLTTDTARVKAEIKDMKDEIAKLQKNLADAEQQLKSLEKSEHKEIIDISAIQEKIENAEKLNAEIREKQEHDELKAELEKAKKEAETYDSELKKIEEEKLGLLNGAKFPVKGLSYDETGVTYKGVPLSQCSSAEQLKISMAMAISSNPKLKIILIRDGSLLDSDNLELIKKVADSKDYQIWLEKVDESGELGVVIEDGMVKNAPKKEVPKNEEITDQLDLE